jgi:hypothetical protein
MIRHIFNQYRLYLRAGFQPRKAAARAVSSYLLGF